jgi:hypothetical protein
MAKGAKSVLSAAAAGSMVALEESEPRGLAEDGSYLLGDWLAPKLEHRVFLQDLRSPAGMIIGRSLRSKVRRKIGDAIRLVTLRDPSCW